MHDAVAGDAGGVLDVLHLLAVKVFGVVPCDQGHRVPRLGRRPLVGKFAIHDIAGGELIDRICGCILRDRDRATGPVHHAPKDRGHVLHDLVGLLPRLEVQVAGKARFKTAQPVWNQLVAVLGYPVERPLVDLSLRDVATQAVAGAAHQVVKAPCRVIGPGYLEGAIPHTAVSARGWVVVHGNTNPQQLHVITAPRDARELGRIDPKRYQGAVGVAQFALDDLGVGLHKGLVLDRTRCGVRRDPAHTDIPGAAARKRHVVAALVLGRGLAGDRVVDHLHEPTAVHLAIDRKVHRAAIEIAIGRVLVGQLRHADLYPNGIHIRISDGAHHRLARLDLDANDHFVFNRRKAWHVALLLAAVTGLQGDA